LANAETRISYRQESDYGHQRRNRCGEDYVRQNHSKTDFGWRVVTL
jgi:hypothetical protein